MKGNPRIIAALNERLSEELTAINQYVVHAAMYGRWGYAALAKHVMGLARSEMGHADELIDRILFLEGKPIVSKLNEIRIGAEPKAMLENDRAAEADAVSKYNESVLLAVELKDEGSRERVDAPRGGSNHGTSPWLRRAARKARRQYAVDEAGHARHQPRPQARRFA